MTKLVDLTQSEARAYLSYLMTVANADGQLHEKEKEFIELQAQVWGIVNFEENVEEEELISLSRTAKMSLLRDSITIAYIDGDYSQEERAKVDELAELLSVESERVADLEEWLLDYWRILERGEELLVS